MGDAITLGLLLLIGGVIYLLFFNIQKNIYIYAARKIVKFTPIMILLVVFIYGYITYVLKINDIKSKVSYITMAIDSMEIHYIIYGAIVLIAIIGCIAGIIAGVIKLKKGR